MNVRAVSRQLAKLGEGPHWDVTTQKLYYVDVFVGDICRLDPNTGLTEVAHLNKTTSFAIPYQSDPNQLLVTCEKDLKKLDFRTGETVHLATVEPGQPSRFNDGKCDALGRLWTGTMFEGWGPQARFYRMDSSYNFIPYAEKITMSNGLAWSLNNDTLYYVDSIVKKIFEFDFDLQEGTATNQRILFDFSLDDEYKNGMIVPDGMTIDVEGKLWVAFYGGGCVLRLDPVTKTILRKVDIPAKSVTSCCFGGPDLDVLYVTTVAAETEEEKERFPQAGAVFAVTGHGTRGQAPNHFVDQR